MPSPTLVSPNTGNYRIGKGAYHFKREGDADFKHMGNAAESEFTPTLERLDHFSSMEGVREKDLSVVVERGGTVSITLEEWTPDNVALALLGTIDEGAPGGPTVEIFSEDQIAGELKFISNNSVGPRWNFHWYNVSFVPSQALNPLSDEWNAIEIEGEVLVSQTAPNQGKFGIAQLTNLES